MAIYSELSHEKLWFSIVMLVYQRVPSIRAIEMEHYDSMINHHFLGCHTFRQSLRQRGDNRRKNSASGGA